jgi:hypothetical protein
VQRKIDSAIRKGILRKSGDFFCLVIHSIVTAYLRHPTGIVKVDEQYFQSTREVPHINKPYTAEDPTIYTKKNTLLISQHNIQDFFAIHGRTG